ncbi:biopolymer transporter ExbD [bacterium]|nr:biopolymer transporter ExbD [bacterium]
MGYRSLKRDRRESEWVHANITPMLNLMVILIPLLLNSAEFVRLGIIELNLPPAAVSANGQMLAELPQEEIVHLDLTVTITDRGFFISSSLAVLGGEKEGEPSISKVNGEYDFNMLSMQLYQIKQKAGYRFPDTDRIILMAEPEIDYQTVISTMDAARSLYYNGEMIELFPEVSISGGVL